MSSRVREDDPYAETLDGDAPAPKILLEPRATPAASEPPAAAPAPADFPALPLVEPDNYVIGAELARGGMGRILSARDRRLRRTVAIKELLSSQRDLAGRFEREILVTARLQHPAIVNLHEAGRWPGGEPFYAMKLVEGRSLDMVVAEARTLEQRLALLPHAVAVVEALAYAHTERIIHRDLKPANVLVGSFGETVVIDWGLAKDLDDPQGGCEPSPPSLPPAPGGPAPQSGGGNATVAGAVMGTPAYMPPEQAAGAPVDERADVYALGALLYHLLGGAPPYAGSTSAEVLARVSSTPPRPLDQVQPGVPHDLLTIVAKAMARDPRDRYPTARELRDDLRRFTSGQLVAAHSYSQWELARRWLKRHRGAVAVGAAALLALAAMGAIATQRLIAKQRVIDDEQEVLRKQSALLAEKEDMIEKQQRVILKKQAVIDRIQRNQQEQQRLISRYQRAEREEQRKEIEIELLRKQVEQMQNEKSLQEFPREPDPPAPPPPPR